MQFKKLEKPAFAVIGKEGSTADGAGFIQKLWDSANSHFEEVRSLAKTDAEGNLVGIWGAMSDFSHSFQPWENFEKGLYLAGVECENNAEAPAGWTKWIVPGYEYVSVESTCDDAFSKALDHLKGNGLSLAGAVHDFTCPRTGKGFMLFPIRKL